MREKQRGNLKEKTTTTTTTVTTTLTRTKQLLSMLGKNITKDVFVSIWIMKNLPIIYHILLEGLWIVGRIKKGNLTEEIPTAGTQ